MPVTGRRDKAMEITSFVRKFINLIIFEKPSKSHPFIILMAMSLFLQANLLLGLRVALKENSEKTLQGLTDCMITMMMAGNLIKRSINNEEVTKLLELIESDISSSHYGLRVRKNYLWRKIQNYCRKKRKDMSSLSRNVKIIIFICGFAVINRNIIIHFSGLTTPENESIDWPTPLLSYCSPELKSPIFFLYFYSFHSLTVSIYFTEGFVIVFLVTLSIERLLADFDILIILLDDLVQVSLEPGLNADSNNSSQGIDQQNISHSTEKTVHLREDVAHIVHHHQTLNRNFIVCADGSGYMISMINIVIMIYCCTMAYLMLTTKDLKKRMNFALSFVLVSLTIFSAYHNGQRILNQNDILRRKLAELPWTDRPYWFKQTLHIMMTRANVDIQMRPFGVYTLNYVSFKDLMKSTYSIGNILYTRKMASEKQ
ncbi:uncharacterized protein LOC120351490 isoform X2 [Nilaparvata lugens]|nr:uncharacterized protein LOC120351490 isoform X2 [Nilaparvata lugens]